MCERNRYKIISVGCMIYTQKAVTCTLNTIAKDDFYKCIQKLYDRAHLCVQLQGIYVEK